MTLAQTDRDDVVVVRLPAFVSGTVARLGRWTRTDSHALLVVAVQALATVALVGPGSLYIDDLRAQAYAQGRTFWPFVVESNGTHLSPVPRVVDWLQATLFPLEHWPAVAMTVAVRVLLLLAFWSLLRRLFGPRPAALLPLGVLAVTPALVPATAWYRQSITMLLATAFVVVALDAAVRWEERRAPVDVAVVALATGAAVCCSEKAALAPVALLALLAAVHRRRAGTTWRAEAGRFVRAAAAPVVAAGLVVVGFVWAYTSGPYEQIGAAGRVSALTVVEAVWRTLGQLVLPALAGGPWRWRYPEHFYQLADAPVAAVVAVDVVVLVALLVALRRHPLRVGRAALLLVPWAAVSFAVIAVGRMPKIGVLVATDTRFWVDLVVAVVLAGALAFLPLRARGAAAAPGTPAADAADADAAAAPARAGGGLRALVVVLVAVVLAGSVRSWAGFAGPWHDNPTGTWVSTLRSQLALQRGTVRLVPSTMPNDVVPAWVQPDLTDAPFVLLLRPDALLHDADGGTLAVDPQGRLVAPELRRYASTGKPAQLCAAAFPAGGRQPARVAFPAPVPYYRGEVVEVSLLAGATTGVDVRIEAADGSVVTPVRWSRDVLHRGPHTMRFLVPYRTSIAAVLVSATSPRAPVCVLSSSVYGTTWDTDTVVLPEMSTLGGARP